MKDERKEQLKKLAVAQQAKRVDVQWNPTPEDRRFLRSVNVSPK